MCIYIYIYNVYGPRSGSTPAAGCRGGCPSTTTTTTTTTTNNNNNIHNNNDNNNNDNSNNSNNSNNSQNKSLETRACPLALLGREKAISETADALELRQKLLHTTPSGWWWWWLHDEYIHIIYTCIIYYR